MLNYIHYSPIRQKEVIMEQENFEQEAKQPTVAEELVMEETLANETPVETAVKKTKEKDGPALWVTIVAGIAAALVLIGLAFVLLYGMGFEIVPKKAETSQTDPVVTDPTTETPPPFVPEKVYTVSDDKYTEAETTVVATVNGRELTNKTLQAYYGVVVTDFIMNYYSYLSTIGLDYTQPLSTQMCYFEENISWEEYFVKHAINTWVNYQSVALLAEEANYELPADVQEALDGVKAELEDQAAQQGFKSVDELTQARMSCTFEDYLEYCRMYQLAMSYTSEEPSDAELSKYFEENESTLAESGITKDSGPIVDVRHILICPEGGKTDEAGTTTTYTDEEWKAAKEKAEAILKEWKDGEATEDSFAKLANEKSEDPGSNTTGGLYEGIVKDDNYVEPFLNWCMDTKHKVGDTGIVKTEFGYHIMYLSYTEEYWKYETTMAYLAEQAEKMVTQAKEKWPATIEMEKVSLKELKIA